MTCAIVFFVAACSLMFTNRAVVVFVDRGAGDNADLLVVTHDEPVKIEGWLVLFFQRGGGDQFFKVLDCFSIDDVAVDVCVRRQVDFGPRHVQETERLSFRERARFVSVNYVVRYACHFLGALRLWTQSTKGTNDRHESSW